MHRLLKPDPRHLMSTFPANAAVGAEKMELEWSDLTVILAICRAGSLSGAARLLGNNHSTIFRKINAIEEKTGVRFFERLPDGYIMTEAGQTAMRYAERIEGEVHALGREVLGQDMRLQGKIRVTAPEGITTQMAPKLFADFCRLNPGVSIEMSGGSSALDLSRREADVAIRATPKPPDTSLGRKVCDFRFGIYSSPQYLKQNKDKPLQEQSWSLIQGTVDWLVPHIWKKKAHGERQTIFSSSTSIAVINATAEGMGFTLLPCYLGDADSRLVRVGDLAEPLTIELWILTHPDLRHTARVKALIAYLYEALKKEADLFEGKRLIKKNTK
jgi:DNA-binding transcriptional LysR family regulator